MEGGVRAWARWVNPSKSKLIRPNGIEEGMAAKRRIRLKKEVGIGWKGGVHASARWVNPIKSKLIRPNPTKSGLFVVQFMGLGGVLASFLARRLPAPLLKGSVGAGVGSGRAVGIGRNVAGVRKCWRPVGMAGVYVCSGRAERVGDGSRARNDN